MRRVITIDCDYIFPRFAAAYLIIENGRALFIENNTTHAAPKLIRALKSAGLTPEQVEYLIITHVHLDHAGGTSALLALCPNARVLAHPKAAKRVVDPEKLIKSARAVYGDEKFEALYGKILPVPEARVIAVKDGEEIKFGERQLQFFYTLGHATHHVCIYDSGSDAVFTGDSFGVRYPDLTPDLGSGVPFIFPSTSPVDFDPTQARVSYQKIVDTGARRAFLTHFGEINDLKTAQQQLLRHLEIHERVLHEARDSALRGEPLARECEKKLRKHFQKFLSPLPPLMDLDLEINAAGIAYVAHS